jgi:hypothetical protein
MAKRGNLNKSEPREELRRPVRWRKYPHLFLIVCEDGKTEPYYFDSFRQKIPPETVFLRTIGTGRSALGVVTQAIIEKQKLVEESRKDVDEVWVVFDKDDADLDAQLTQRFNHALTLADKNQIQVGWSNEVFELWLLLHFSNVSVTAPIARQEIYNRLELAIRALPAYQDFNYIHGKVDVIDLVFKLGSEKKATTRAATLLSAHADKSQIESNPGTAVHLLVEKLRGLIEYYSYSPQF